MKKSLFFAAAFLAVSVSGFGQIRVDSEINTYIGDEAGSEFEIESGFTLEKGAVMEIK